jgi:23S rRNA pseudouridine2605 synthase
MAGNSDEREGDRIAKVIARAGLASRRQAEAWIAAGRVAINGKVIASPAVNVGAKDRIAVDGAPLRPRERTRLFLHHKPRGLVTTHADPQARPTIFGALPQHLPRLVSVGRLDLGTEGLLLLTNDGSLARVLELPETGWLRRYRVRAHGRVTQGQLDGLRQGITLDGIRYGPIEATLDREQGANVWLTFAIREGKNREVRNVLGHLGLKVARLIRVSFGPFQLGNLPPGAVEEVKTRHLREQLGERLAARAGCDFSAPVAPRIAGGAVGAPGVPLAPPPGLAPLRDRSPGGGASRTAESDPPARKQGRHGKPHRANQDNAAKLDRPHRQNRRGTLERIGEPELARREKRRRRYHGKRDR